MTCVDVRKFKSFPFFKDRFLSKIPKEYFTEKYEDKCWSWTGSKFPNGYGQITWGRKNYYAHRISYLIFNNLIPLDKIIRHTCNNPSCINPKHLILGNYADNAVDMLKTSSRIRQKLNEEAVKVIKWMLKYQNYSGLNKKLAKLHKVHTSTISDIKHNHHWSWVEV